MIYAGLALLAVAAVDGVRPLPMRRWLSLTLVGVVIALVGVLAGAYLATGFALVIGAAWYLLLPGGRLWVVTALAALSIGAVVWIGATPASGLLAGVWNLPSPFGPLPLDLIVLTVGVGAFLLETGNVIVRVALAGEKSWRPDESEPEGAFKGGRLIGPLERVIVLLLTLAAAYPLLAAMLAAKGIVRFPEISRDGETGRRAEYFLVGTLVSWTLGLGGAFLVWWAANA